MTREEINKAIEEEAERRYPIPESSHYSIMEQVDYDRQTFIKGANYILSLFENKVSETWLEEILLERTINSSTNLEQQNNTQGLNNSEWISVKEEPEQHQRILVTSKNIIRIETYYRECGFNAFYTHWMPLPEPPNPQSNPELKAEEKILEQHSTNKTKKYE